MTTLLLAVLLILAVPAVLVTWLLYSFRRFRAYHLYKKLDLPVVSRPEFVRYLFGELGAMGVLGWWHVRARFSNRLRVPPGPSGGPPVLCVHGILQNGTNLWGIRRALARHGRATRAVSLGPFGRPLAGYVPPLVAAFRELVAVSPDGRVDVVAHSMGGVILRMALAKEPVLGAHLRRVVTLGSPHAGAASTRGARLGSAVRHLGRRSPLFAELPPLPAHVDLTTVASRMDLVVYPQSTCHLEGARAIDLSGVGHAGLLIRTAAIACVVEAICAPEPVAPAAPEPATV